jgi:hypothetical protein
MNLNKPYITVAQKNLCKLNVALKLEMALKILDDEDVNISSLGVEGTDLKEQSENIRVRVLKLFNVNITPVLK